MEPTILFEDEQMVVIDKPAGLTVNKSDTTKSVVTLQDWMENKYPIFGVLHDGTDDFHNRSGLVHRLDKETSGVLVLAKTSAAFHALQMQFKERKVKKIYLALSHGVISPETGEINVPVGRTPWNRTHFGVVAGGRESKTNYKVLGVRYQVWRKKREPLSLVELYPQTGRTHQIRVHLKHINHPIFADELYAGRKTARDDRQILPRLFLHAAKLSFFHPVTGEFTTFTSPLPEVLQTFWDGLEK